MRYYFNPSAVEDYFVRAVWMWDRGFWRGGGGCFASAVPYISMEWFIHCFVPLLFFFFFLNGRLSSADFHHIQDK